MVTDWRQLQKYVFPPLMGGDYGEREFLRLLQETQTFNSFERRSDKNILMSD